jgi:hypothetical protein
VTGREIRLPQASARSAEVANAEASHVWNPTFGRRVREELSLAYIDAGLGVTDRLRGAYHNL